jgi:malate dehydrogenase (oxaloacetate-decarboxylating)(NADP+)
VGSHHPTPLNAKKSKGVDILHDPLWNKGSAFTEQERDRLGLRGLLPPVVNTIEEQSAHFLNRMRAEGDNPMAKNLMLQGLHNRNETLFHRVLVDAIEEVAPLVYTPTVGLVCQQYSHTYTRPRGLCLNAADRGNMSVIMQNWPASSCQVVVVTDGSRILGLGDLGANGMGIPIGKLALYCAYGGIAPHRVLPVMLDLGTDNQALLDDPEYRGMRHPRLQGEEYTSLLDEFMQAVYRRFPKTLVQFEDFSSDKASGILDRYRNDYLCFNDDIQGTGATVLAGVLGALRMRNQPPEALASLKVAVVGAGSAGIGVAQALRTAMLEAGCPSDAAAASNFYVFDKDGLLGSSRAGLTEEQLRFARTDLADGLSVEQVADQASARADPAPHPRASHPGPRPGRWSRRPRPSSSLASRAARVPSRSRRSEPSARGTRSPSSCRSPTPPPRARSPPPRPMSGPTGARSSPRAHPSRRCRSPTARSSRRRSATTCTSSPASASARASAPRSRCPTRCCTLQRCASRR